MPLFYSVLLIKLLVIFLLKYYSFPLFCIKRADAFVTLAIKYHFVTLAKVSCFVIF